MKWEIWDITKQKSSSFILTAWFDRLGVYPRLGNKD
jgi:hypothetical protein